MRCGPSVQRLRPRPSSGRPAPSAASAHSDSTLTGPGSRPAARTPHRRCGCYATTRTDWLAGVAETSGNAAHRVQQGTDQLRIAIAFGCTQPTQEHDLHGTERSEVGIA